MKETEYEQAKPKRKIGCLGKIIIGVVLYFLCNYLFVRWISSSFSGFTSFTPKVTLTDNTVYRIDLKGNLVEQGQEANTFMEAFSRLYGMNQVEVVGLDDLLRNIKFAKESSKISGILLSGGELSMGPAKAKELRDALLNFKESGKFIYAYAERYGLLNYYVASVADSVFINPVGSISWDGLYGSKLYYTRLLHLLGIEVQIFKVGSFKAAVEPFSRTSMSDEDRKQTKRYLHNIWTIIKQAVAKSRHLSINELDRYANEVYSAKSPHTYVKSKMIDGILYRNDVDSLLYRKFGGVKPEMVSSRDLNHVATYVQSFSDKIAVIYAEGNIVDKTTQGVAIVQNDMVRHIRSALRSDDIKAVVFRVNSPGGSADASEQIWHAMSLFKEKNIPVVVSMSDYAASGGYYISAGADYIIAQPNTLTGSIGIFGIVPNFHKVLHRIRIDYDSVRTNAHSGVYENLVYGKVSDAESGFMQKRIERGYVLFLDRCAEGRHKTRSQIDAIAQGRIWTGKDAVKIGLVDQLGNIEDAIQKAAELAQLDNYSLTFYPQKSDPLNEILKLLDTSSDEEKMILKMKEFLSKPRIMCLAPTIEINKD